MADMGSHRDGLVDVVGWVARLAACAKGCLLMSKSSHDHAAALTVAASGHKLAPYGAEAESELTAPGRVKKKRVSPHVALLKRARPHYEAMLEQQGGVCAICGATPKSRRLALDHDHARLVIRSLLCHRCNRALPTWITPAWLRLAAAYLERDPVDLDALEQAA